MGRTETHRSLDRTGFRDFWIGTRVFNCPYAETEIHVDELTNESWFVSGTEIIPGKIDVTNRDPIVPGNARIVVHGQSEINPDKYAIGSATLTIKGLPKEHRVQFDLDDEPIETSPDENGYFHKPVKGSNILLKVRSLVIVHTAYELQGINWHDINALFDTLNQYSWPNIGNAEPETMRFINAFIPKFFLVAPATTIVPLDYHFWWDPRGWNNLLEAQRFRRWPKQYPVLSRNDDPSLEGTIDGEGNRIYVNADDGEDTTIFGDALKKTVLKTEPAGEPEPRRMFEVTDLSWLRGYMNWQV